MKNKGVDFTKLLKGYSKGWVAISSDFKNVIAYSKTLGGLRKKISKENLDKDKVYYFPSGENYSNYVG